MNFYEELQQCEVQLAIDVSHHLHTYMNIPLKGRVGYVIIGYRITFTHKCMYDTGKASSNEGL